MASMFISSALMKRISRCDRGISRRRCSGPPLLFSVQPHNTAVWPRGGARKQKRCQTSVIRCTWCLLPHHCCHKTVFFHHERDSRSECMKWPQTLGRVAAAIHKFPNSSFRLPKCRIRLDVLYIKLTMSPCEHALSLMVQCKSIQQCRSCNLVPLCQKQSKL